jgi:hypothetical protein
VAGYQRLSDYKIDHATLNKTIPHPVILLSKPVITLLSWPFTHRLKKMIATKVVSRSFFTVKMLALNLSFFSI